MLCQRDFLNTLMYFKIESEMKLLRWGNDYNYEWNEFLNVKNWLNSTWDELILALKSYNLNFKSNVKHLHIYDLKIYFSHKIDITCRLFLEKLDNCIKYQWKNGVRSNCS